jgi:serine/threonine protein kinase
MKNFKFLTSLGSGGQGRVYKVLKIGDELKINYALKSIFFDSFEEANKTLKEVMRLQKLNHPNVCPYLEVFMDSTEEDDYTVNLLMPFCELGDLEKFVKTQILSEEMLNDLFLQIAKGIHYLHENNIAHRDLKLENIFVTRNESETNPTFLIGDFGFSASYNEMSKNKSIVGTMVI